MMGEKSINDSWLDFEAFKELFLKAKVEELKNNVLESKPNPKVSVRVITYNQVDYIRQTLDNVLAQQTNFDYEILLGDDESTDGTREICIEYAKKYPNLIRLFLHKRENNIKILDKPCGIFQIAYNIFSSRGKYIANCAGDDYWTDPLKLQKQFDYLEKNPEVSYCSHLWITSKDDLNNYDSSAKKLVLPLTVMQRNVFQKLPKQFLEVLNEDNFLYFILKTYGRHQYLEDIKPSVYGVHDTNMWAKDKGANDQVKYLLLVNQKLFEAYKGTKFEKKAKTALYSRYIKDFPKVNLEIRVPHISFLKENKLYWEFVYKRSKNHLAKGLKKLKPTF